MGRIIIMGGLWEMLFGINGRRELRQGMFCRIQLGVCERESERGEREIMKSNNQIVRWPYKRRQQERSLILRVW